MSATNQPCFEVQPFKGIIGMTDGGLVVGEDQWWIMDLTNLTIGGAGCWLLQHELIDLCASRGY
jgi:hypothetical protein